MHILFCGDPHSFFNHINVAARAELPDAVVLLGDMQSDSPLDMVLGETADICPIYWILGNHDTDSVEQYDNLIKLEGHPRFVHLGGGVKEITSRDGSVITIAGLDGVFRSKIWMPERAPIPFGLSTEEITVGGTPHAEYLRTMGKGNLWRNGVPLRHRSTIFPDEYLKLSRHKASILITHEAPAPHTFGFPAIGSLALAMGARYSFHGHQHQTVDYGEISQVRARGVGYRDIVDLTGRLIAIDGAVL